MTFWWLSHDFLLTFIWLFCDFLMTFSWLCHDVLINFSWLSHDFIMTFSWLSNDFLMTFSWLFLDFLMTFSWSSHDSLVTFSWLLMPFWICHGLCRFGPCCVYEVAIFCLHWKFIVSNKVICLHEAYKPVCTWHLFFFIYVFSKLFCRHNL